MKNDGRLIVMTNREPFTVVDRDGHPVVERAVGGLIAALEPAMRSTRGVWISSDEQNASANPEIQAQLESMEYSWRPVQIPAAMYERYYLGLSNKALWPLYHTRPGAAVYLRPEWDDYRRVNDKFAEVAHSILQKDDIVWIHDYQLSLVPNELRRRGLPAGLRIGFLLHVPFASYELFRTLPWAREILEGMLGASLIVFHVVEYCEHFFDCVEQLLNVRCDRLRGRLWWQDRWVYVRAVPIGIDTAHIYAQLEQEGTRRRAEEIKAQVATDHLILGVDRLDYTKGIKERLQAFETFLGRYERWRNRVAMVQIAVPSRARIEEYQQLRLEIEQQTGHVNGVFGNPKWTPLTLMVRSIPFDELIAYYLAADVAMVTPLRDGMNLVAKEYVASHRDRPGVLILSEFAGAAQQLTEAELVNPYDVDGMAEALHRSLERLPNLPRRPMRSMNAKVAKFDIQYWMDTFLSEMLYVE
jgi:trehalose 6-phosphate synthase/phosphatase